MIQVTEELVREVHRHLVAAMPHEGCGAVLLGADNVTRVVPMTNVASQPRTAYAWSAEEMHALLERADQQNAELWIIYHSHPETMPEPSTVDLAGALHVGVHYWIFGMAGGPEDVWFNSYACTELGVLEAEQVVRS